MTERLCHAGCGRTKQHGRGYRYCTVCGPVARAAVKTACNRRWRAMEEPAHAWAKRLWTRYRLSVGQFFTLLDAQEGRCAVCGTDEPGDGAWHVDHDHACCPGRRSCGRCVRGLLCAHCNRHVLPIIENQSLCLAAQRYLAGSHG